MEKQVHLIMVPLVTQVQTYVHNYICAELDTADVGYKPGNLMKQVLSHWVQWSTKLLNTAKECSPFNSYQAFNYSAVDLV